MNNYKKFYLTLVFITTFLASSFAQFNFSVSPGLNLNGASFGYKVGGFSPSLSFQYMNFNTHYLQNGKTFDADLGKIVDYTNKYDLNASMMLPSLNLKYSFITKNNIKAYLICSFLQPIVKAKLDLNSGDTEFDTNLEADFDKYKKSFKAWSGEIAFGAEYFFDENFSLSGEFGLRHFNVKYTDTYDHDILDYETGDYVTTQTTVELKNNINPTFTKISLNFYF